MREAYPNEIMHYGIRGQKWGIRRFQNPDGTLTAAGRRRYGTVENLELGRTKSDASKIKEVINRGSVGELKEYQTKMTSDEIKRAIDRWDTTQKLDAIQNKNLELAQQKVERILNIGTSAVGIYNMGAGVYNTFNKKGNMLPTIGSGGSKKGKDGKGGSGDSGGSTLHDIQFQKMLKTKDMDYFKKHADEFTKDEIEAIFAKANAAEGLKNYQSRKDKNKNKNNSDNQNTSMASESSTGSGKDKDSRSTPTYSQPNRERRKEESKIPTYSQPNRERRKEESKISTYSQPSQERRKEESKIPTYSQPSQTKVTSDSLSRNFGKAFDKVETPTYSQPSQKRTKEDSMSKTVGKWFDSAYKPKHDVKTPTYSQPSQVKVSDIKSSAKAVDNLTSKLLSGNQTKVSQISSQQQLRTTYQSYQDLHPNSDLSFSDFSSWFD